MSVYEADKFQERVTLAAAYIAAKRRPTRTFDTCFEMHDGDAVAVSLLRRAENRPNGNLAQNLFTYISEHTVREAADKLAHVPTAALANEAARMRAKSRAEFKAFLENH